MRLLAHAISQNPEEFQVLVATTFIHGNAATWLRKYNQDVESGKAEPCQNFEAFAKLLRKAFAPKNSVLILQIPNISSDEQLDKFRRGLSEELQYEFLKQYPDTRSPLLFDKVLQPMFLQILPMWSWQTSITSRRRSGISRKHGKCFYCHQEGHIAKKCLKKIAKEAKNGSRM